VILRLRQARACASHREALLAFASHGEAGPTVRRALDHVDRCRACESDLAATTLVLFALRRLHEDALRTELSPDAWSRLQARLGASRREPSRLLSGMPGALAAFGICAVLVGPAAIAGGSSSIYDESSRLEPSLVHRFEAARDRAADSEMAAPFIVLPYRGVRIAPPPISADLPTTLGPRRPWVVAVVAEPDPRGTAGVFTGIVDAPDGRR
jgi:hypothetical protein